MINAAKAAFSAMAYTQTIRPVIEGIQKEVLTKFNYKLIDKHDRNLPEFVTEPKHAYLMSDKDFGHYMTEIHALYIAAGFKVEFESCPLLIAERVERDANIVLVEAMEPITKISYDMASRNLDNLRKLVDLTLKLLSPYCK